MMCRRYTRAHRPTGALLRALLALGATSLTVNPVAWADDPETIYLQRVSVAADGTRSYYAEGRATITLRDGSAHTVDHDTLEDPDGNRYGLEADVYQTTAGGDVVYEFRLVRQDNEPMTVADRLEAESLVGRSDTGLDDTGAAVAASLTSAASTCSMLCGHDELELDASLDEWAETAARGETVEVHVVLTEAPVLDLPEVSPSLADSDPVYYLEQMSDRLVAIEDRKTEMADLYEPILAEHGVDEFYAYWLINAALVEVDLETLALLASDDRVARLEALDDEGPEGNSGSEIMDATGVVEYLDAGWDGELASGRSSVNDMYIGQVDTYLYNSHPAWEDCGSTAACTADCGSSTCPDRLVSAWMWNGLIGAWWPNNTVPSGSNRTHGTRVAGMMVADLTDDQDSAVTVLDDQIDKSGLSTESSFSFISYFHGAGLTRAIQRATWLDVDVSNVAAGTTSDLCGMSSTSIDAVNAAALNGVFLVKSAGNQRHDDSMSCKVTKPGTAAGAFTVGALEVRSQPDLTVAEIWQNTIPPYDNTSGSSRGGDAHGRSVIDLVIHGGKEDEDLAMCDGDPCYVHSYDDRGGVSTSHASGAMSGAAADFKHYLADAFAPWPSWWTDENVVGLMHAALVLQGDGAVEGGGTADPSDHYDDLFGAGRFAARVFDDTGMNAPWRFRLAVRVVDDQESVEVYLNPDDNMVNQALPASADTFRSAVWWYEPNLASSVPAELWTFLKNPSIGTVAWYDGYTGQKQRVGVDPPTTIGGYPWSLYVKGMDVSASVDSSYYYGLEKRKVFFALYWEDQP